MNLHTPAKLMPWFLLGAMSLLVLLLLAMARDAARPWKPWQSEYLRLHRAHAEHNPPAVDPPRKGIHQILVPALNRVDRCTTCHLAVSDPRFAEAPQPLRTHPPSPGHAFEQFGCTVCHRGNGMATVAEDAHAGMLPGTYVTASCLACHDLSGLPEQTGLHAGRRLFETHGCRSCHQLNHAGGRAGPALDGVGLRYNVDWLIRHFKDPASVSPGSGMPPVKLEEEELEALTRYVAGLVPPVTDPLFASARTLPTVKAGQAVYQSRGCVGCHALKESERTLGPSLLRMGERGSESRLRYFLQQTGTSSHRAPYHPLLRPDEQEALLRFLMRLQEPENVPPES